MRVSKPFCVTDTEQIAMDVVIFMGVTNVADYDQRDFDVIKWLFYNSWFIFHNHPKYRNAPPTDTAVADISGLVTSNAVEGNS